MDEWALDPELLEYWNLSANTDLVIVIAGLCQRIIISISAGHALPVYVCHYIRQNGSSAVINQPKYYYLDYYDHFTTDDQENDWIELIAWNSSLMGHSLSTLWPSFGGTCLAASWTLGTHHSWVTHCQPCDHHLAGHVWPRHGLWELITHGSLIVNPVTIIWRDMSGRVMDSGGQMCSLKHTNQISHEIYLCHRPIRYEIMEAVQKYSCEICNSVENRYID